MIKTYLFPLLLLAAIILGGITGFALGDQAKILAPFGDIFLNLILTAIVPLLFFSVSSAIARVGTAAKLGKLMWNMTIVFLFTSIVASLLAIIAIKSFPLGDVQSANITHTSDTTFHFYEKIVEIFTVSDFSKLLTHNNILPLIVFSIIVGLATAGLKERGASFKSFLQSGEAVFMRVFNIIMYYAPIGFFAYFAVLVSGFGPTFLENYLYIGTVYYVIGILYFILAFTAYAYLAGHWDAVKRFWGNIFLPSVTAIATCSSAASIPANLLAAKSMGVPDDIVETTIPLGSMIHKDGSVIGGVIKIAFLFAMFHIPFSGSSVILMALGVSILVGTVMGAIPSGGMIGELLILSVYGFPSSALMAIAAISIIIDPLATLLNVTGNTVSSMMIARLTHGRAVDEKD